MTFETWGLAATNLTDNDAVWSHTESVPHQLTDSDLTLSLDIARPRLQCEHVVLMKLELSGVLHRDDALVCWDVSGEYVENGRLTRAGPTRYQDVEPTFDTRADEVGHPLSQRFRN